MRASAAMTRDVICLLPTETLRDAWDAMERFGVRHMPVLDGERLVGIVSDRDVLRHAAPVDGGGIDVPALPITAVMSRDLISCQRSSTLTEVVDLLLEHQIDCLPVLEPDGSLVGLVTTSDLLPLLREMETGPQRTLPYSWRVIREEIVGVR